MMYLPASSGVAEPHLCCCPDSGVCRLAGRAPMKHKHAISHSSASKPNEEKKRHGKHTSTVCWTPDRHRQCSAGAATLDTPFMNASRQT
jgi:hypothetical protein